MRYRVVFIIAMVLTAGALAGCDKCGRFENLNIPNIPKSCHADPPPG